MNSNNRWIISVTAGTLIVFVAFAGLLWKIGLFDFTGSEASAKIVAATLALIGALFGSLVTIFGMLLKHSFDHRSLDLKNQAEKRLQFESERDARLKEEAAKRLKLEAAIQAVQLLSTDSGTDVPMTKRAGVLFSLAHLDLMDLSITMLHQMLSDNKIDAETAAWLFNKALQSKNESAQLNAATLLCNHADKLLQDKGCAAFPESTIAFWDTQLPQGARKEIAYAILTLILSRRYKDWEKETLNTLVVVLISIWRTEPYDPIRKTVGACLEKILQIYPLGYLISATSGVVSVDKCKAELAESEEDLKLNITGRCKSMVDRLGDWLHVESESYIDNETGQE